MDRDEGPWKGAIGHDQDDAFCIELIGLFIAWGDFGLGRFCPRGILSGGILSGGILSGGILSGGVLSRGILSGGILSCHQNFPFNRYYNNNLRILPKQQCKI